MTSLSVPSEITIASTFESNSCRRSFYKKIKNFKFLSIFKNFSKTYPKCVNFRHPLLKLPFVQLLRHFCQVFNQNPKRSFAQITPRSKIRRIYRSENYLLSNYAWKKWSTKSLRARRKDNKKDRNAHKKLALNSGHFDINGWKPPIWKFESPVYWPQKIYFIFSQLITDLSEFAHHVQNVTFEFPHSHEVVYFWLVVVACFLRDYSSMVQDCRKHNNPSDTAISIPSNSTPRPAKKAAKAIFTENEKWIWEK